MAELLHSLANYMGEDLTILPDIENNIPDSPKLSRQALWAYSAGIITGKTDGSFDPQGVMTRAVDLLCRRVFAGSDVLRIFAEPFARNAASCRVLEKAGFRYEGTLRCNAVKNGIVLDMKLYARLRPELCPELCPEGCPAGCPQK